jgi:hypothetical protein
MTPGLIIEDANFNSGSRMEVRDENGVAEFRIDASGDVDIGGDSRLGIGIANPEAKLHIVMPSGFPTPSTVRGLVIDDNSMNSGNQLEIRDDAGNARMVVDGGGRVGIGTGDPNSQAGLELKAKDLHMNDDGGSAAIHFTTGGLIAHTIYNNSFDDLRIHPQNSLRGITITQTGNVGINDPSPQAALDVNGRTKTDVLEITAGSDLSERFDIRTERSGLLPTPGMVVSIDPENPGSLKISSQSYDTKVAGILSGAGGVNPGMIMGQENSMADGAIPVALTGRVYCCADASDGAIRPGDLLTTSATPGHAMKVHDYPKAQGAIIGKAMTGLDQGQGFVLVLVTLQ